MKWNLPAGVAGLMAIACPAQAQTTATMYGSVDASLVYIDNAAGSSLKRLDSGSLYSNRLGLRGSEDLGSGLAAIFTIESGFNVDDGTITLGGRFWGRQSFVGLSDKTWGTVTLGRQYDFLYAGSPLPLDMGALLIGGLAGATGGAGTSVDNHSGGARYDNSVKWQARLGGWTLGAMVGLGNENKTDKMASAVVSYRAGPLWAGAAYLRDNHSPAASGNRIALGGMNWDFTPTNKLVLTLSQSKADLPTDRRSQNTMVQLGWMYRATEPWLVGLMAGQSDMRNAAGVDGQVRQFGLGAQYSMSRRTTLYGMGSRVSTSGSAGTAYSGTPGIGAASLRSSDRQQAVIKAGLLHKF